MTANLLQGMEICLHLTYFFLSEMFHCYKTGIYFAWILKVVQRIQPVWSVRTITYPPLQSSLWTTINKYNPYAVVDTSFYLFCTLCVASGMLEQPRE